MEEDIKKALTFIIEQLREVRVNQAKIMHILKTSAQQSGTELQKIFALDDKEAEVLHKIADNVREELKESRDIVDRLKKS